MRAGTIAFLSGIVVFLQVSTLPPLWLLVFLPLTLSVLLLRPKLHLIPKYILLICCSIVCGFLWAFLRAEFILANELDRAIEGETVIIVGEIVSLPEIIDSGVRFEFQISEIKSQAGINLENPGKVRLGWYRQDVTIQPGEHWRLHVRLKRPYGFSNPGGFDYEGWLFQHRLRATGYVRIREQNDLILKAAPFSVNYQRYLLQALINKIHVGDFEKSFLSALSLGDRSKISVKQWQTLTQTGTSHLLAISGLHIGLVAGLFFIIGRWLWAFAGSLPLHISSQRFAALAGLSGALMYAALAGFSIPTQRALIMLSVWMLSLFFNRKYASSDIITISLLAVLIIDPFAAMDAGFWLSFIAISIIAYGMMCRLQSNISGWRNVWWKWGRVQYLVAVGLFPVLVLWFQQYPLVGILANIIAVPYISLIVVPLVLLGIILLLISFPTGEFILQLAGQALGFLWPFLEYLSRLEFNLWHSASPSPLVFVAGMAGVLILLMPKGMPARWTGLFWLVPLLLPHAESPKADSFLLAQLDVGQGLASVIQTQNHALIYDTGDKFSQRFNAADAVIIPFLKHQNILRPDLLLVSHGDRDHIGGARVLLTKYPEMQVLTSIEEKIVHSNMDKCVAGQRWQWDGVNFEILSPNYSEDYRGNNSSCVLKVSNDHYSILLAGDIEQLVESRLVRTQADKLSAKLLIAPHHGSKTSSSPDFIDKVSPEIAIFPVGYRNRFGFPKQDIISRYESRQVKILNTARDGALLFRFETPEMIISRHRQQSWRFWTTGY